MNTLLQQNNPIIAKTFNVLSKFFIIIYGKEYLKLSYLLILIVAEAFVDFMISKESTVILPTKYVYESFKKFFVYTLYIVIAGGVVNIIGITSENIDFRQITISILFLIQSYNLIMKFGILGFKKESNLFSKSLKTMLINSEFGKSIIKSVKEEEKAKEDINNISEELKKGEVKNNIPNKIKKAIEVENGNNKENKELEGENDEKHS